MASQQDLHALIAETLLSLVPPDGSTMGNTALRREIESRLKAEGLSSTEDDYWKVHADLIAQGRLVKGQGRGGSVRRATSAITATPASEIADSGEGFALQAEQAPAPLELEPKAAPVKTPAAASKTPARRTPAGEAAQIIAYRHPDKRVNNPEVGMVTPATDPEAGKTRWAFDPHLDPVLAFDPQRAGIEALIDGALESGDADRMRAALEELKRLQSPYLNWAGKAERTSFEIDTVSLHVHERVDPASILSAVRKAMKGEAKSGGKGAEKAVQPGLFDAPFENLPLRDAIDFYRHEKGWANRLVAGDSLLVMNSLLHKESMAGRLQMIYIDPPYGIKYGSNFQPFVGKRDVKDRNDADLTQEPEMIKAFRDTWELGIHSYLTYLRDRLLLARELLNETGSVFVQISDENLHHVRELCDEIFGFENFVSLIAFKKTTSSTSNLLAGVSDYLVWYSKSLPQLKYHQMYLTKELGGEGGGAYGKVQLSSGERRALRSEERYGGFVDGRVFRFDNLTSQSPGTRYDVKLDGRTVYPKGYWKTEQSLMPRLLKSRRVAASADNLYYVRFIDDFPAFPISNSWDDTSIAGFASDKRYVVETSVKVVERCILMTTDPGDLVLDPTCGSGTTAYVAEKWGRRWITCDTSRVAITLAKQRLMTASFDYFELKYPHEGLKGGFIYKTVPHVTLKSIANNPEIDAIYERLHPAIDSALAALNAALKSDPPSEPFAVTEGTRKGQKLVLGLAGQDLLEWEVPFDFSADWPEAVRPAFDAFHVARQAMQRQMDASIAAHADQETLYDQPAIARNKLRITGPFTVEAVPFPSVQSFDEAAGPQEADASIARTGESGRQHQWRDELLKTGIRGKGGQMLKFADLETLADCASLHASGHLDSGERVVVSFGPEHAALEQRQVVNALNEAGNLFPLPKMIVFCAFTFDPEAAKDIDALKGITALKAQMNTDLLTEDLKKARASNQSFWLMGQPEVELRRRQDGQYEVEVHGFDYFDTVKGELVSGGKSKIAMWALDTDYDERSLFPRQVFFPMAGKGEGWDKLKKNIRAELDESRLHQFHGTVSLPFDAGDNRKIAVKIVDDRGIESLKVVALSNGVNT
ncbi:site-specific DNA-methyltransferase [Malikia sp.]|uniref:site-specific DNA-methyltransferase n=1 Tax=Malikia sp. TaxID=2070706 RepID=UPI00262B2401|nr:site-specific DNA-methyltransferase [Malikia sp.]MDD2728836.1 site-specific DNA-methyltransferase [Malikia sp.]